MRGYKVKKSNGFVRTNENSSTHNKYMPTQEDIEFSVDKVNNYFKEVEFTPITIDSTKRLENNEK